MRTAITAALTAIALVLAILAAGYIFLKSGGLSARNKPGGLEYAIAKYALNLSIPSAAKHAKHPVRPSSDDPAAAKKLYSENCAVCHGINGSGKTETGKGLSPNVPNLGSKRVQALTAGEMHYIIKNGIRFTGMPGWNLPDKEIWRLVWVIRHFGNKNAGDRTVP